MIRAMRVSSLPGEKTETRAELDSHADTCVVGKHAIIIHDYGRHVNVTGYDTSEGTVAKDLRTGSSGLAYDDPRLGSVTITALLQAIEIPHLEMISYFSVRKLAQQEFEICPWYMATYQ